MTTKIKFFFVLISMISTLNVCAQTSFRILGVNDSTVQGKVNVLVEVLDGSQPTKDDFQLFGNGGESDPMNFDFTPADMSDLSGDENIGNIAGRNIFFLIESSEYTSGMNLGSIKKSVSDILGTLDDNDKINIGYYGPKLNGNNALEKISLEFTTSKDILRNEINKISTPNDTTKQVHTFKAIHEAIGYVGAQKVGEKILIIISRGSNNSTSPIKSTDCKERAMTYGVKVFSVLFKSIGGEDDYFVTLCEGTGGRARNAQSTADMQNTMTEFLVNGANTPPVETGIGSQYNITFDVQQSKDKNITTHNYQIRFKNETQNGVYKVGKAKSSFLQKYGIFIIIILAVLAALVVWQVMEARRKKRAQEEEEELEEERLAQMESEREAQMRVQAEKAQALEEQNIMLQEQLRNIKDEISEVKQNSQIPPPVIDNTPSKFDMKQTRITGGSAAPRLIVATNMGQLSHSLNKLKITIGRNPSNDIQVPEKTVSSNHAVITIEGGSFYLTDINSTNGTFVNGTRISKKMLKSGDMIKMGAANCKFEI